MCPEKHVKWARHKVKLVLLRLFLIVHLLLNYSMAHKLEFKEYKKNIFIFRFKTNRPPFNVFAEVTGNTSIKV